MSDEQNRRRARGEDDLRKRNDLMVLSEFVKHHNRALAVPEVAMLLGGQASFNIEASFIRLETAAKIYKTATEFHIGPTVGDEVQKSPRYRRVA